MYKNHRLAIIAGIVAVFAGAGALAWRGTASEAPKVREFELSYRALVKDLPPGAGKVEIWLPYPHTDEAQRVEVTDVSSPYPAQTLEDRLGNRILHLAAEHPGRTEVQVAMTARVTRDELIRKDFAGARDHWRGRLDPAVAHWLGPDRLVPLDGRIRGLSREVTAGKRTDLAKARAIYDYVVATMRYDKSGTGWGHGDIYWACDAKRGNCTDFHALFTGLARAAGIPARFEIGFPIPPQRGEGKVSGYHCWSQFYLDGYGWVPVDASEAWKHQEQKDHFFGALDEDRVKFSEGRDLVLAPSQHGAPLNYFVYPYVEVDGKPHQAIDLTFAYRDLPVGGPAARPVGR